MARLPTRLLWRVAFENGTKGSETRQDLIDFAVLNGKGREHFLGCVVVPLEDPEHGFVGLYGRGINNRANVRLLFLPGPKREFLNHQVLPDTLWVEGTRSADG